MIAQLVADLEIALARERLEAYRPSGGTDDEMLVAYVWNMHLCEALYPSLHGLEVSLRNGIHRAATGKYRTEFWFDTPGLLQRGQPEQIQAARDELGRRKRPQTAGRIIAELRFSFWTSLLSGPYHDFWMDRRAVMLRSTFAHTPRDLRTRKDIHARYNALRIFRNRVFHYEPIWTRPDLAGDHDRITEAISWISPSFADLVRRCDRFPDVVAAGRAAAEAIVDALPRST